MRGLEPALVGRVIVDADVRRPDLRWPFPDRMAERLTGVTVLGMRRRSKYILADLSSHESLLIHLGMSGRLMLYQQDLPYAAQKHDHVVLTNDQGLRTVFNDPRRFGAMDLISTDQADTHPLLAKLGPEPLGNDFSDESLSSRLAGRRTPIKSALLDQSNVAGLGNIYVCEALWRAGLSPVRHAGDIDTPGIERLVRHIRETLTDAIDAGGSSLKDYRQADGELGYFQHSFAVYGREGAPCQRSGCDGIVERLVQSGRSSFFCSSCQS